MFDAAHEPDRARLFRLVAGVGLACSVGILIGSYCAIAAYTARPWLWSVIVHESGDRTLLQTILFYEHMARELPLDLLLGAAIAGGALFALPGARHLRSPRATRRLIWFAVGTTTTVGVILGGTLWAGGFPMLYENLFQFPTRPGAPLIWGGHWRYHLLSHVTLMLISFGLAAPLLLATRQAMGNRKGLTVFAAAFGAFLVLALVFVPGTDSFRDPVFLGHQAREVLTHAVVTVPMAWSVCILLARQTWNDRTIGAGAISVALLAAGAGVITGLFLLVASLATSATSQGQSESLAVLIFPHFFEHTFSYVVATLTAGFVFEWAMLTTRESGRG